MKIFYTSDIHVDTYHFEFTLQDMGVKVEDYDVVVLAGDLTNGHPAQLDKLITALNIPVIILLGNHDYWNNEFDRVAAKFTRHFEENLNVHVLDYKLNPYVIIDDVVFIGSTLWTDCGENSAIAAAVTSAMPDCSRIIGKTGLLKQSEIYLSHLDTLKVFEDAHAIFKDKKKVLLTHHCLSRISLSPTYSNSLNMWTQAINRGYYSNLDSWVEEHEFIAVISGHTHYETDYLIGSTRMLSNPLGYPGDECATFNASALLEI